MNLLISDLGQHENFLPLSFTRAIADFRIGILTIREKWEILLQKEVGIITEEYLQKKYKSISYTNATVVAANIIPNKNLISVILKLKNQTLVIGEQVIAYHNDSDDILKQPTEKIDYTEEILVFNHSADIFRLNGMCLEADYELITKGRKSVTLSPTNTILGSNPIFVEDGAFVECATINTTDGPIYIGKNSKIMEGANIRGPFAICENSEVKMGAKIYGPTTIGPWCKIGGEINNTVFFAYSSKAHDGFLGNAVIGEWCNLGADTNNSNLKNNYAIVKLWNYEAERFISTGMQFCGLIMGDHSKSGINTMFNTGTVVGVSANIFGSGFPRNFIPSFSWGGHAKLSEYKLTAVFDVMEKVMQRRNVELSEIDKSIFKHIFDNTAKYRNF